MNDLFKDIVDTSIGIVTDFSNIPIVGSIPNFINLIEKYRVNTLENKIAAVFSSMENISLKERVDITSKVRDKIENNQALADQIFIWIDKMDELKKSVWYSSILYSFCMGYLDEELLYKLISILNKLTSYELEYIKTIDIDVKLSLNKRISYMLDAHVFHRCEEMPEHVVYELTDIGKALKINSLNYGETHGGKAISSFEDIKAQNTQELTLASDDEINELFK